MRYTTKSLENISGLSLKPTYEELIDYVQKDPDQIKFPDRRATFLRQSLYLTQLDGEGMRYQ